MTIDHDQPDFSNLDAITFDVDGVLTDGGITYLDDGRELKTFNVQDGAAFKMLMQAGVAVGWITGRSSPIVHRRAEELGIRHLYQGISNKSEAFADFLAKVRVTADRAAHVGDDLPDLALFPECAIGISVPNGHPVVRAGAAFITTTHGGAGVARELCELDTPRQGPLALPMSGAIFRSLVGIACLGLLSWVGYFALQSYRSNDQTPQASSTSNDPDSSTEPDLRLGGATITEFDQTGSLKYRLRAKEMSRFEATTETALVDPMLRIISDAGEPWNVESTTGTIREQIDPAGEVEQVVLLRENVVLRQLDKSTDHEVLVIRSDAIDLFPARQFAKSLASVMIDSDVGRTQAASMEGDLKTGQLHLSSDAEQPVHSIVLPTQFKSSK